MQEIENSGIAPVAQERPLTLWELSITEACRELEFSVRLTRCLQNSPFATIAEAEQRPNSELMRIPGMGAKSVREFREALKFLREGHARSGEDVILWALEHRTAILALMRGEVYLTARVEQSDPSWLE